MSTCRIMPVYRRWHYTHGRLSQPVGADGNGDRRQRDNKGATAASFSIWGSQHLFDHRCVGCERQGVSQSIAVAIEARVGIVLQFAGIRGMDPVASDQCRHVVFIAGSVLELLQAWKGSNDRRLRLRRCWMVRPKRRSSRPGWEAPRQGTADGRCGCWRSTSWNWRSWSPSVTKPCGRFSKIRDDEA